MKILLTTLILSFFALYSCNNETTALEPKNEDHSITFSGQNSKLIIGSLKSVSIFKEDPIEIGISFHDRDVSRVEDFFESVEAPFKILLDDKEFYKSKFPDNKVSYTFSFKVKDITDHELLALNKLAVESFSSMIPLDNDPADDTMLESIDKIFSVDPRQ